MFDIETVAMARFDDLATQLKVLYSEGRLEEAALLKQEGCDLAAALDDGTPFLYLSDLSAIL
jgi:hypothetical protein